MRERVLTARMLLCASLFCALTCFSVQSQVPTFTPNDPSYDAVSAQMMHVPEGYAVLQQFEKKGQRFADQATVVVIDGWISTRHPELKDNHLSQYDIDFTGESTWENDCDHGNAVASRISAATNNEIGIASLNLTGRLKVVSFKIGDGKCNVAGNSDLALQQVIVLNQQQALHKYSEFLHIRQLARH